MAKEEDKARFKAKNKKVKDDVAKYAPDGGAFTVEVPNGGRVAFKEIKTRTNADDVEELEVHLAGAVDGGDPHYVITNPPIYVIDPNGTIPGKGNTMKREDPVLAVAMLLARFGGRQKGPKR